MGFDLRCWVYFRMLLERLAYELQQVIHINEFVDGEREEGFGRMDALDAYCMNEGGECDGCFAIDVHIGEDGTVFVLIFSFELSSAIGQVGDVFDHGREILWRNGGNWDIDTFFLQLERGMECGLAL